MAFLSWNDDTGRLKTYSSTTRKTKGVVKIEVEVNDQWDLSYLLRQLADLDEEQDARARMERNRRRHEPEKRSADCLTADERAAISHTPQLALTYQPESEER